MWKQKVPLLEETSSHGFLLDECNTEIRICLGLAVNKIICERYVQRENGFFNNQARLACKDQSQL